MDQRHLIATLEEIVGPRHVFYQSDELVAYDSDAYQFVKNKPRLVVLPASTAEVVQVVKLLHTHQIPFVPRGAGTGLAGGSTPATGGEVIIGLSRMNRIVEVDLPNQRARVQPGVVNIHLSEAAQHAGYYYAPDPASQKACTIGGNVANNSGGPHCLKYGVTTNHVLGLQVVLPDGELVELGGKAVDVPGYDLVGLLVGSEGTMGIVTEITVRLTKLPQAYKTVLALFHSVEEASNTVSEIIARGFIPGALEMMDYWAIQAVERGNFPIGYPRDLQAVLLIEVEGLSPGLEAQAEEIVGICQAHNVREVRVAQTPEERAAWWNNRKTGFGAAGKLAPNYLVNDGTVPRSRLAELLKKIGEIGRRENLIIANVFHAGDGNLHPLICYDEKKEPGIVDRVMRVGQEILALCVEAGGTISGEHGIGVEKMQEMSLLFTQEEMILQDSVRRVFDPENRCNPGKIFPIRT